MQLRKRRISKVILGGMLANMCKDSTTRVLLERILAQEEEHANDMHDLLVSHQGQPMLEK